MNKIFYLTFSLLLGTVVCSCNLIQNASFNPPDVPVSDFWYTNEPKMDINGSVHDDHGGGHNPLNGLVIAAWEIPNDPSRSLYVYGTGTLAGFKDYTFTIHLRDTLPKFILRNTDTMNAIAAGHIFIVGNMAIKDGDTLHYNSNWDNSYQVIGSMNDVGIIFIKGNPMLLGRSFKSQGFNLFFATKTDQNQSVKDFVPIFDPNDIQIQVDDNGGDCKKKTPFWLQ